MTDRLEGRLIALGVTGSIAAYKAVELLRLLRAEGADVVALLTPAATAFVGPLTFQALSRHAVETDVLALLPDGRIGHIVVADTGTTYAVRPGVLPPNAMPGARVRIVGVPDPSQSCPGATLLRADGGVTVLAEAAPPRRPMGRRPMTVPK